jgi:hypothetical protein
LIAAPAREYRPEGVVIINEARSLPVPGCGMAQLASPPPDVFGAVNEDKKPRIS